MKIEINDTTYGSIKEACKQHNISIGGYQKRRLKGMSIIEAITTPKQSAGRPKSSSNRKKPSKHEVTHNGVTYKNMKVLAEKVGINYETLKSRIVKRGMSVDEAVDRGSCNYSVGKINAQEQIVDGITYPSITALAEEFNINPWTLMYRINNMKISVEDAVKTPVPITRRKKDSDRKSEIQTHSQSIRW